MRIFSLFIFWMLLSNVCFAQTFWKIKTESNEEILLTIEINQAEKKFKAYTRKDGIKEIAGFFAYNLARTAGKLKYPEIVYIEGEAENQKDSLKLKGVFYYTDKKYRFQAAMAGGVFTGNFTDNRNKLHYLNGTQVASDKPIKDYVSVLTAAVSLAEKKMALPDWLKSSDWKDFKDEINRLKSLISDDYELGATIMWNSRKLPFSPFEINKTNSNQAKNLPSIRVVKPGIGLIEGNLLPGNTKEMDSIATIININKITKLVIDLRGRSRMTPEKCLTFLNYLSKKEFTAGVFVTQKYWNFISSAPLAADYRNFKEFSPTSKQLRISGETGYILKIVPSKEVYKGTIYVLTDSRTSRVSEILASVLKKEKMAILIGQKTAGMPFVVETFEITGEFGLQIPVAEFYNPDGKSFHHIGIEPDKQVSSEDLMNYIRSL